MRENKAYLDGRIEYVKPLILDLGSVAVAYGGVCETNGTGNASAECYTGGVANACASVGTTASGNGCASGGTPSG